MSHSDSISVLATCTKGKCLKNHGNATIFLGIPVYRISVESALFATGDELATMKLAEVDDSSDAQYCDREVGDGRLF